MDKPIGKVIHFYDKISVAVVKLSGKVKSGESVKFSGHDHDFSQVVSSMQKDHKMIEKAGKGEEIAIKTDQAVKKGDSVFMN